jgi:hypothetical protein
MRSFFPFAAAVGVLALAGAAQATPIYATDFEAPAFTTGSIAGQNGWSTFGSQGTVESGVALSGRQAVMVDGAATGQTGPFVTLNLASPGTVDVSGDIMLTTAASGAGWQFAALGPSLVGFAGGIDIGLQGQITAITDSAAPQIGTLTYDAWHHVDLLLDFDTQTFAVKFDGTTLASGLGFCGGNGACTGAPVTILGDALFDTFGGAASPAGVAALPAPGYLDNFAVSSVAGVPEPSAWSLMIAGFGLAGAALRRRRAAAFA